MKVVAGYNTPRSARPLPFSMRRAAMKGKYGGSPEDVLKTNDQWADFAWWYFNRNTPVWLPPNKEDYVKSIDRLACDLMSRAFNVRQASNTIPLQVAQSSLLVDESGH